MTFNMLLSFFWEAHVDLNYIPVKALDKFVLEHK